MISIAFVGAHYQDQIETNPEALRGLEIVFRGDSLDELRRAGLERDPDVLVLDLDDLGEDAQSGMKRLLGELSSEMILLTYAYARRDFLDGLQTERTRLIQGMPSLSNLRSQMMSLIVRDIFATGKTRHSGAPITDRLATCPRCGTRVAPHRLQAAS